MDTYNQIKKAFEQGGNGVFDLISAALVEYANASKNDKEKAALQSRGIAEFLGTMNGIFLSDIAKKQNKE